MRSMIFLLSALMITSCGYQLRGQADLPPAMDTTFVYIQPKYSDLARAVRQALRGAGVELKEEPESAHSVLQFDEARFIKEVGSIGAGARIREFSLEYRAVFSLVDTRTAEEIVPTQTVRVTRELSFDDAELLGAQEEEAFIREQMVQDVVNAIMLRLTAIEAGSQP